jgi:hypothetical protein
MLALEPVLVQEILNPTIPDFPIKNWMAKIRVQMWP